MLTCKQFLEELSEFLDEEVSPQERKMLEEHISACPNCWVVTDTTKKTIEVYRRAVPVELPAAVRDRLFLALEKKMAGRREP
ncbi:MAG: zf-HC2 domain-containing protein [Acidobacteria bacterium]|nr:zf-HC2 domain-containing protein [Acidobacteriota bacterium]